MFLFVCLQCGGLNSGPHACKPHSERQRSRVFFLFVDDRLNTNTSIIIYTCKYIQMFPKVGLLKETKGGGKEKNARE
jgi:hypothetical protein